MKHKFLYQQGTNTVAAFRVISFEKIVAGVACIKIIFGEINPWWIGSLALGYYIVRTIIHWMIGYFWEETNGYEIESEWNKDRIPPTRVYVMDEKDNKVYEKPGQEISKCQ